jgi:deoxyribodipyrimidine photolyase-related protein
MKTLRLILGDQLHEKHSWFENVDSNVLYLIAEMRQETDYVCHHVQKIAGFFLAMRTFASTLKAQGHQVIYYTINDDSNPHNLETIICEAIKNHNITTFAYQWPDEYRLDQQLKSICERIAIPTTVYDSEHFYSTRDTLSDFFSEKKQWVMENFYRMMRKKHQILTFDNQPL